MNRRAPGESADTEPLLPQEALTVPEALGGYTAGTTWLNGLEDSTGRLDVGFAADVVAIDRDILGAAPEAIGDARVTHTYADGREVFRR